MADFEPAPALPEEPEFGSGSVVTPAPEKVEEMEPVSEPPKSEAVEESVPSDGAPEKPLVARVSADGVVLSKCEFSKEGVILKVLEE